MDYNFHVYYQYVVAHPERDKIIKKLLRKNILRTAITIAVLV